MPNTPKGFPYPAPSDAPDGAAQVQALAEKVDAVVPYAVAAGLASVPALAGVASGNVTVTLPVGRFKVAPRVVASLSTGQAGTQKLSARAINTTASSFGMYVFTGDATNTTTSSSVGVEWVAVQMTATAASG